MRRAIAVLVVIFGTFAALVLVAVAALFGMLRSRDPRVLRAFTSFQRDRLNPEMLKKAGTPGEKVAVLETVGRRTGTAYETPLTPVRDGDVWFVPLVYGPQTSWARNAVAAGKAVLRTDGERRRVDEIEIVALAETPIAQGQGRFMSALRIDSAVKMHDRGVVAPGPVDSL